MTVIEAINDTAKALTNLSKVLVAVGEQTKGVPAPVAASIPVEEAPKPEKRESAEDTKEVITIEQVRAVMAEKSQAGLTAQVKELLEKFGANKLSAVKPEDYADLMAAAKELN